MSSRIVKREMAAETSRTTTSSSAPFAASKLFWRTSYAIMVPTTQKTSAAVNNENFEASERNGAGRAGMASAAGDAPFEGSAIILVHRLS